MLISRNSCLLSVLVNWIKGIQCFKLLNYLLNFTVSNYSWHHYHRLLTGEIAILEISFLEQTS